MAFYSAAVVREVSARHGAGASVLRARALTVLLVICLAACQEPAHPFTTGYLGGRVLMAPGVGLAGATVIVDQLNLYNGKGDLRLRVTETTTDEDGYFSPVRTDSLAGLFLIRAAGGTYRDPISGARISLDTSTELQALHRNNFFQDRSTDVYVTAVHSMVVARVRAQLAANPDGGKQAVTEAVNDSYERLNRHFGNLDWERVIPADLSVPATSPTDDVRAAFVLGGLAVLADDLREASESTPQAVNLSTLVAGAVLDLGEDQVFDGNDGNSSAPQSGVQVGSCLPLDGTCTAEPESCQLGACRVECDLYANAWRGALVGSLRKYLGPKAEPSPWNRSGLGSEDAKALLEAIGRNQDPELFGDACLETTDRVDPTIVWEGPADGDFVKGSITVRIRATDDGESLPRASFEGHADADGDPTNNVAVAIIDTRVVDAEGHVEVTAKAVDAAHNERKSTRVFRADNTLPAVTLARSGLLVDDVSGVWWTASETPTLQGTLLDDFPDEVEVVVAGEVVATVPVPGEGWSATLPAGTISAAGKEVVIRGRDQAGNVTATAPVLMRLDATPPAMLAESSLVYDEAASSITHEDSPGNVWLQRHAVGGTPIDLAQSMPGACATVRKYSHLLHQSPVLGFVGLPNPLKLNLVVSDDGVGLGAQGTEARVTLRNGDTPVELLPWSQVAGIVLNPQATRYDVGLYRDGSLAIPALATTEGEVHVELRATDKFGRVSQVERCWNHRILAPKLYSVAGAGQKATGFAQSLYDTGLSHPPGSTLPIDVSAKLLNANAAGAAVWIRKVKNYLATPTYVTVSIAKDVDANSYRRFEVRRTLVNRRVAISVCGPNPCTLDNPASEFDSEDLPPQQQREVPFRARLFVMNGSQLGAELVPCPTCANDDATQTFTFEIPPRGTPQGAPLVEYGLVTFLRPVQGSDDSWYMAPRGVGPPDLEPGPFREFVIGGVTLTGKVIGVPGLEVCTQQEFDEVNWRCTERANRQRYRALRSLKYDFLRAITTNYFLRPTANGPSSPDGEGTLPVANALWATNELPFP